MIAVERTSFYADGIFQGGTLLSWDNFRTYNWKHDQVELLLRSNGFWFSNRFILKIPVDEKKEVESILAQKIAREP
jgi:hypothetical protein